MTPNPRTAWRLVALLVFPAATAGLAADGPRRPVQVTIEEGKDQLTEPVAPLDPRPRIAYQIGQNLNFGFMVDGVRISYSINGGTNHSVVQIDGQNMIFGGPPGQVEVAQESLGPGPFGKKRIGIRSVWNYEKKIRITQVLQTVPSKVAPKSPPGTKRRLDACLVHYTVENLEDRPHKVGFRSMLDMLMVNNDGALFASPTTHPGKILDGVELKGKEVPEYLQVLQQPNLQNPGLVAHFNFRPGRSLIGPDRVVMTRLGSGFGQWDIPPVQAMGDSAIGIFFSPRPLKGKGKLDFGYAYGQGLASNPDSEGRVSLVLGGSLAPGKRFSLTAVVDEPVEGQTLTLELPRGMTLLEGKTIQPVPAPPGAEARSIVLWKGRVQSLGKHVVRVHSSNGVTYTRTIRVAPPAAE